MNKEINDANALQSSADQFVALKLKLKWTHEPYDFIANKAILHFNGKANWKMYDNNDLKKPLSKGTYAIFTNKCILACSEKIRDIRELETLPIKEWKLEEDGEKPNNFILKPLDSNDSRQFVIECSDYISMMNYKRTFETCLNDANKVFKTPSKFKKPTTLSRKMFISNSVIISETRIPLDEKNYKFPASDRSGEDGAVHPRQSRSIRNPPKVNPSEVFLINSGINGFFGRPEFKESDISDVIHGICSSQSLTLGAFSNTPVLELPELRKGQSTRLNQTRHRHKLSANLSGVMSEEPQPQQRLEENSILTSPRKSEIFIKKPFSASPDESDEKDAKVKTPRNSLFKKLAPKSIKDSDDESDSDSD